MPNSHCQYCSGDVDERKYLLINKDTEIGIYIDGNGNLTGDDELEFGDKKINFCPSCGRSLQNSSEARTMECAELDILEKSKLVYEKREKFLTEHLNPHEAEMKEFIREVIEKFDIKTNEDWNKHNHLIPDCGSKLIYTLHFQKVIEKISD